MKTKMPPVSQNLYEIKSNLPTGVELVAVSKYHPLEALQEAYDAGQRIFGENRPQEMTSKHEVLPADVQWHMIGHLQTNKVKMIVPYVSMIESVDSLKLLQEINRQAMRANRIIPVLLEIHVAQEETKSGFTPDECRALLESGVVASLGNVKVSGLMCVASNTDDEARIRSDFRKVHRLFDELKCGIFAGDSAFRFKSWGMSGDYKIAIEEGANLVRIGSAIFGQRDYSKPFKL